MKIILTKLNSKDKKIQAIKAVRTVTGLGLKEAKDLVENITDRGLHQTIEVPGSHVLHVLKDGRGTQYEVDFEWTEIPDSDAEPPKTHSELAEEHLVAFAKELLDGGRYDAATNITNLLSLLRKTLEEN